MSKKSVSKSAGSLSAGADADRDVAWRTGDPDPEAEHSYVERRGGTRLYLQRWFTCWSSQGYRRRLDRQVDKREGSWTERGE